MHGLVTINLKWCRFLKSIYIVFHHSFYETEKNIPIVNDVFQPIFQVCPQLEEVQISGGSNSLPRGQIEFTLCFNNNLKLKRMSNNFLGCNGCLINGSAFKIKKASDNRVNFYQQKKKCYVNLIIINPVGVNIQIHFLSDY